jgi:amidase
MSATSVVTLTGHETLSDKFKSDVPVSLSGGLYWQEVAKTKQAQRAASIPEDYRIDDLPPDIIDATSEHVLRQHLAPRHLEITSLDATDLSEAIRDRKYTSLEVIQAFARRAILAQAATNCLTEIFLEEAFVRARELDEILQRTGKPVGLLHGVPVSIKVSCVCPACTSRPR